MAKPTNDLARPVTISLTDKDRDLLETIRIEKSFRSVSDTIRSVIQAFVGIGTGTGFRPDTVSAAVEKTQLWINTSHPELDRETLVLAVESLAIYCRDAFDKNDYEALNKVATRLSVVLYEERKKKRPLKKLTRKGLERWGSGEPVRTERAKRVFDMLEKHKAKGTPES